MITTLPTSFFPGILLFYCLIMKKRYYCCAIVLLLLSWLFAAYKPGTCQHLQYSHLDSREGGAKEYYDEKPNKIGSRPPKCDHKCGGCEPCKAIQVPTTAQFANYQPESWKCKCQTYFFNP